MSDSVTPETAAHQAPPSLGFSRQEHWSGLPFPSPMHESEKWKEVGQSCLTLRDPMDFSLPGSSVHGIFQARVLEWGPFKKSIFPILTSSLVKLKTLWHQLFLFQGQSSFKVNHISNEVVFCMFCCFHKLFQVTQVGVTRPHYTFTEPKCASWGVVCTMSSRQSMAWEETGEPQPPQVIILNRERRDEGGGTESHTWWNSGKRGKDFMHTHLFIPLKLYLKDSK